MPSNNRHDDYRYNRPWKVTALSGASVVTENKAQAEALVRKLDAKYGIGSTRMEYIGGK